ncbi:16S rRNA (cytosine(1402)-N(4))-methyltransferase RsmH [Ginsengibacter hankyongi]|uniref:Ribosomal RNA small subunit methyltransferase H n=1 Tax=Ginsengibacter hankyongi TaxID=2607284 RepID=A0A5J5IND6_9BACT|nr:16S rRNA (cytosine(1402)-N(4))-methyltransferase RsmH [Ginsengibacter hankyongi]KAA9041434.1 16S rRNA (cytosine(1402)-N(4))-methyltransferase RsmH [Ginsengibacter hankyongi]
MQKGIYHVPVLMQEVINGLQIDPSGIYVDCTFGGGGHASAILKHLNSSGRLIAFDQDADAVKNLPDDDRVIFIPHNFRHLQRFLRLHKISKVNGVLADLGVSSHQFNVGERGFSTRFNGALDMRMNQSEKLDAAYVIQNYSEERLHKIFEQYGEVTNAKTLAKLIVQLRKTQSLKTINEFKNALYPVVKGNPEKYFAQVFQALRIEVNDEFGALKEMLLQAPDVLVPGGRIAVITFHSLEDRLVKNFFKNGNFDEIQENDLYGTLSKNELKVITKKPITPSQEELKNNPRSRSSKLRIAEKIKVSNNISK